MEIIVASSNWAVAKQHVALTLATLLSFSGLHCQFLSLIFVLLTATVTVAKVVVEARALAAVSVVVARCSSLEILDFLNLLNKL
jgi:hypothetical protein